MSSEVTEKENPELDVPQESPVEKRSFREVWNRASKTAIVALLLPLFAYVAYILTIISIVQLAVLLSLAIVTAILSLKE